MSGFEIGRVGESKDIYNSHVRVSLETNGIEVQITGGVMLGFGGFKTLSPAQTRELGNLLLRAAANFDDLVAKKQQMEAEEQQLQERKRGLIHRALFGGDA